MTDLVLGGGVRITLRPPLLPRTVVRSPVPPRMLVVPARGPKGDEGEQGPPGVGGIFDHHQISPAATWTITHNLGKYVEPVLLLDDAPARRVLTDIDLPDVNTAVLTFPAPASGWAHFTS